MGTLGMGTACPCGMGTPQQDRGRVPALAPAGG